MSRPIETVAVTGANGFVGRRVVSMLSDAGLRVRALVRDARSVQWNNSSVEAVQWDATQPESAHLALVGVDAICHAAAFVPPDYSDSTHARRCLEVNALGTLNLLEACVGQRVRAFVHLSSGNIYEQRDTPVSEEDPIYPSHRASYYLASKVCAETWALHFLETGRLAACVLRPSAIYGPGMAHSGLVPTLMERLQHQQSVFVRDGGRFRSDLVYVDDVARAASLALEKKATGAFNIGSGRATTSLELAQTLVSLLGCDPTLIDVEPAHSDTATQGFSALNIERARQSLGYVPSELRDGLARMLALAYPTRS
ncbi:MAG: NAD(P)-dependent oxidoreductase [Acidimicrobiia bacterium]